jgi:hypothetical protein
MQWRAAPGGVLHDLEAGVDGRAHGAVREQRRGAGPQERGEHLEHAQQHGLLGAGVGDALDPAVGERGEGGVDRVARARGALVEHVDAEDLEHGGQRDARGRRRGLLALHHVQERGEVRGRVGAAPRAVPGLEEEPAEGLERVDERRERGLLGGGDGRREVRVRVRAAPDDGQQRAHLGVEHAGDAQVLEPRVAPGPALRGVGRRRAVVVVIARRPGHCFFLAGAAVSRTEDRSGGRNGSGEDGNHLFATWCLLRGSCHSLRLHVHV